MTDNTFQRYLTAKRTVDDRALNGHVRRTLLAALPPGPRDILEVGAGTGTMIDRLGNWPGVLDGGRYTAVDALAENIMVAQARLSGAGLPVALELEAIDLFDFMAREQGDRQWDLLIAHAFLDLVDAPATLPRLFDLLRPGGLFYFTINFDGHTILEPVIDPILDTRILALYHQTMDERLIDGRPSGDSRSGRRLLRQIPEAGGRILAAGSSDWVVVPLDGGYVADEAFFLHFIIDTIEGALAGKAELDGEAFARWIRARHAQIDAGELIYIAHQLDVVGLLPAQVVFGS